MRREAAVGGRLVNKDEPSSLPPKHMPVWHPIELSSSLPSHLLLNMPVINQCHRGHQARAMGISYCRYTAGILLRS